MRAVLVLLVLLPLAFLVTAVASPPAPRLYEQAPPSGVLRHDSPPAQFVPSRAETTWYGNADPSTGLAVVGGVWDFDSDPVGDGFLQGWTSADMSASDRYVHWSHVTADSFPQDLGDNSDPYIPMMLLPESTGQLWVGIHQAEATERDFITGMGYGNNMCQRAFSPLFDLAKNDEVRVRFDYFSDSEPNYDYTYIYVLCYDADTALVSEPMLRYIDGISGDTLGMPWEDPQRFNQQFVLTQIDSTTTRALIELRFFTDGGWSDEDGLWDCSAGPFAFDETRLKVNGEFIAAHGGLFDFEDGEQGWSFDICTELAIGAYLGIVPEEVYAEWMDLSGLLCQCGGLSGNALEMV
ncbi:hypothetical protein ACFL6M_07395, partial [Candidatus Eisenbacteria bacterium]